MTSVVRIVSGGQTGADRAALDCAIALGLEHGGYCPRGRRAEDGPIPGRYELVELESTDYTVRTEKNVLESDGTLLITRGKPTGGSALTARLARAHEKPLLHVDLDLERPWPEAIRTWLVDEGISTLNVAGPRASGCRDIAEAVTGLLTAALTG